MKSLAQVMVVFGTRPEAIKLAPLIRVLRGADWCDPVVVVTGQHREMLDQVLRFFELAPDCDLNVFSPGQTLAEVTSRTIAALDPVVGRYEPSAIVVQGDTTTTFASALAGFYRRVPVVHVEAGLRSGEFGAPFPEETNRRLTTQLASLHLAATAGAASNLHREGVDPKTIAVTGNTVIDALQMALTKQPAWGSHDLGRIDASGRRVVLVTAHRRESWGAPMEAIGRSLAELALARPDIEFVFPIHRNPIVRDAIIPLVQQHKNVTILDPLPYGEFCRLLRRCDLVLTDSGGLQEEAPSLGKPVLILRDTTERPEAVACGAARIVGTSQASITREALRVLDDPDARAAMAVAANPFGDGRAAERIAAAIAELLGVGQRLPDFTPGSGDVR